MTAKDVPQPRSLSKRGFRLATNSDQGIRILLFVLLAFGSVAMFYPFIWMFFSSFKTHADIWRFPPTLLPEPWTLEAYRGVLDPSRANLPAAYYNSLLVSVGTVISVVITSSMGGICLCPARFSGSGLSLLLCVGDHDGAILNAADSALHRNA